MISRSLRFFFFFILITHVLLFYYRQYDTAFIRNRHTHAHFNRYCCFGRARNHACGHIPCLKQQQKTTKILSQICQRFCARSFAFVICGSNAIRIFWYEAGYGKKWLECDIIADTTYVSIYSAVRCCCPLPTINIIFKYLHAHLRHVFWYSSMLHAVHAISR